MLPSRPLEVSPHVMLLRQYDAMREKLFDSDVLRETEYYRNACVLIDAFGHYFDATREDALPSLVRRFVEYYTGAGEKNRPRQRGQSEEGAPIRVRPVADSDCYEIVDGNHRLAIAYMKGQKRVRVKLKRRREPLHTPLQSLLQDVLWLGGRYELYQPVASPELEARWITVRKCTDRFDKMRKFLKARGLLPPTCRNYLDLASSYGWFVWKMQALGFESTGVERDPIASTVGEWAYGLEAENSIQSECASFLANTSSMWDVTSCFSLVHHFVRGNGPVSAEEFIRRLDRVTGRVLFFDTGQGDEAWFRDSLAKGKDKWNADYVGEWLRKNTSFREVIPLGVDEDRVPPFEDNYSRMLFACVR